MHVTGMVPGAAPFGFKKLHRNDYKADNKWQHGGAKTFLCSGTIMGMHNHIVPFPS